MYSGSYRPDKVYINRNGTWDQKDYALIPFTLQAGDVLYIGRRISAPELLYFIADSFSSDPLEVTYSLSSRNIIEEAEGISLESVWYDVIDNYNTFETELEDTDARFAFNQPRPILFNIDQSVKGYRVNLGDLITEGDPAPPEGATSGEYFWTRVTLPKRGAFNIEVNSIVHSDLEAYTTTSEVFQNLNLSDQYSGSADKSLVDSVIGNSIRDFGIETVPSIETVRSFIAQAQSTVHSQTNIAWKPGHTEQLFDYYQSDRDIKLSFKPVLDIYRSMYHDGREWNHLTIQRSYDGRRGGRDTAILNKKTGVLTFHYFPYTTRFRGASVYRYRLDKGAIALNYLYGYDKTDMRYLRIKRFSNAFVEYQILSNMASSRFGSVSADILDSRKRSVDREMEGILQEVRSTRMGIL